ncbi:MAG TPA: hypothetical protein VFQ20_14930 [Burkholderiaceae bacterium]|nr:hypothetical protein [Burkholderiaceae bacterium]
MTSAILLPSAPAQALGLGESRAQVVLGQPLNLAVPVTLADGESLAAECADADVTAGESRLPVRVRVTQGRDAGEAVIRIATSAVVEEPILQVTVRAGCPTRITRTLTLLADPPTVAPVVGVPPAPAPASPATSPAPVAAAPEVPPRATRPATPARSTARSAGRSTAAGAEPQATAAAPAPRPRAAVASAARPAASRPATTARPRLQLDAGQVARGGVAPAASAALAADPAASAVPDAVALAAAEAASAAQRRLSEVEAELARVRADAKAQTEAMVALRKQLAIDQAQRERQALVMPLLVVALAVLALIAGWLALRSRRQAPPAGRQWWDASRQPGASQLDPASRHPESQFGVSEMAQSSDGTLSPGLAPPAVAPEPARSGPDSLYAPPTLPVPVPVALRPPPMPEREDEANRAMSVDEQIDLEQQADFFIALGHDDAAIDLLMAHLRSTGGGTPLPFLKLLEIHRRRADREAYERTRVRFNQRFNSIAPDWNADPKAGRLLEDYPLTIGRVQAAWRSPLDAMAELEALLFRRGTGAELFDLPAYQEVLFLYTLARDLHNAEKLPDAGEAVDVLLPIGGAAGAAAAAPEGTITLRPEFNQGEALSLDLDLSTEPTADTPPAEPPLEIKLDESEPALPEEDVWGVTGTKRKDV